MVQCHLCQAWVHQDCVGEDDIRTKDGTWDEYSIRIRNFEVKEACSEVDVTFVDNDANFTFRNGAADDAAFHRDGLHLSESGVGRLLLNLSIAEQPLRHCKRQRQQQHRHVSNSANHGRSLSARVALDNK